MIICRVRSSGGEERETLAMTYTSRWLFRHFTILFPVLIFDSFFVRLQRTAMKGFRETIPRIRFLSWVPLKKVLME